MRVNKLLRVTGWVLIWLGAIVLEFAAYEVWGTSIVTKGRQNALRQEFIALGESPVVAPSSAPARPAAKPKRSSRAIALLKIPKIKVDVIVVEGVTLNDLAYGPGRYPRSARIGAAGNTAIAGHRTGWGSPFINMDRIGPGDTVTIEMPNGRVLTYRVTRTTVVGPSATWVLEGNPQSKARHQLTLTTCTPKYTSRNRLIVWADLVRDSAEQIERTA